MVMCAVLQPERDERTTTSKGQDMLGTSKHPLEWQRHPIIATFAASHLPNCISDSTPTANINRWADCLDSCDGILFEPMFQHGHQAMHAGHACWAIKRSQLVPNTPTHF